MRDRYELSRGDSVFVAKKYLKESVYRSAFLEGIAVTFPQTEAILENAVVNDVATKDIAKVFGIRDGWEYVLSNLEKPVNLKFLEELHQVVAREDVPWDRLGKLRNEAVRISGTNYLPKVPVAEKVHNRLAEIMDGVGSTDTDKAVTVMLYIMRSQLFLDGNKRVGTLACNKILIERGRGIFSLPPELKEEFSKKLVCFYETGEMDDLKKMIEAKCLIGL